MSKPSDEEILKWAGLCHRICAIFLRRKRMQYRKDTHEDWYNTALVGVWRALETYSPESGTPLKGYVGTLIQRELARKWRTENSQKASRNRSMLETLPSDLHRVAQEHEPPNEILQRIRDCGLTDQELSVLISVLVHKLGHQQIATRMKLTRQRVQQIAADAEEKIRRAARG